MYTTKQYRDLYKSEADLCAQLADAARARGFAVHAETALFDLLLVATRFDGGFKPGDQIGVQAKLQDNMKVLSQALPRSTHAKGGNPHYFAVLVPYGRPGFKDIARRLKISVINGAESGYTGPRRDADCLHYVHWYRHEHERHCWVPDCEVPDMKAGINGPVQMTPWKVNAIKLCLQAERDGFITKADFSEAKVDVQVFVKMQWLKPFDIVRNGRKWHYLYELNPLAAQMKDPPPHLRFARIADELRKLVPNEVPELQKPGGGEEREAVDAQGVPVRKL